MALFALTYLNKNMKILADISLQSLDLDLLFPSPFYLSYYQNKDEVPNLLQDKDLLLCRSTMPVNASLFNLHRPGGVATASSGRDHVDVNYLDKEGIRFWDAKGSNAQSVADYVLSCIAFAEKHYGLNGQKVGIIGAGAVGGLVGVRLKKLGFEMKFYDPPKSLIDSHFHSVDLEEILAADIICIHANLHGIEPHPSKGLISAAELSCIKEKTVIINAARGGIVCEEDLLNVSSNLIYCTDVYANEPDISEAIIDFACISTPHIAGHSIEAKQNVLQMLSQKLHHYFQIPLSSTLQTYFAKKSKASLMMGSKLGSLPGFIKESMVSCNSSWQAQILSLYNPIHETEKLKQAKDKKAAFLNLRKAHTYRHDFNFDS